MMDLQTQKLSLIEEVLHVQNSELLEKVAAYLHQLTHPDDHSLDDLLDDLPPMPTRGAAELKTRLEQSRREMANGQGIPHEQVKALMQARFQS